VEIPTDTHVAARVESARHNGGAVAQSSLKQLPGKPTIHFRLAPHLVALGNGLDVALGRRYGTFQDGKAPVRSWAMRANVVLQVVGDKVTGS